MTKFDHEKQNSWDKVKKKNLPKNLGALPETRIKGKPVKEQDLRVPCPVCQQKVLPKNLSRHCTRCHDAILCPICNEAQNGTKKLDRQKKLGRHIKKIHGHKYV